MTNENSVMRTTIIVILSIVFTGALLVYTGIANLDLLTTVYPDPQFVGFGMLALEGGVLYWTGYYLLHWHGAHRGIAVCMAGLDFLFSMVGFFLDVNLHAGNAVHTSLPPVIVVLSIDIAINVGMGILVHFLAHGRAATPVQPLPQPPTRYAAYPHDSVSEERRTAQLNGGETAVPFEDSQPQYVPVMLAQSARMGKRSNRSTPPLLSRLGTAMRVLSGSVVAQVQVANPPVQESEPEVEQEPTTA